MKLDFPIYRLLFFLMSTTFVTIYASSVYQRMVGMKPTCKRASRQLEHINTSIFQVKDVAQSFLESAYDNRKDEENPQDVSPIASTVWAKILILGVIVYMALSLSRIITSSMWRIPGPKATAFTRMYEFYYNAWKEHCYAYKISELHQIYGPIVRINPNEIHIHDTDFHLRFGLYPLRQRDPWYHNVGLPHATGLLCDIDYHRHRRNSEGAVLVPRLMEQGPEVLLAKSELMCRRFRQYARDGVAVNLSDALRSLARDCLSIIFIGSCDDLLLRSDLGHHSHMWTGSLFRNAAIVRLFPSLLSLEQLLPDWACWYASPLLHAKRGLAKTVVERIRAGSLSDGSKCLAQALASGDTPAAVHEVIDDVVASLTGGSEAIGHSLTNIFHHLMQQPDLIRQLRVELKLNGFDIDMSPALILNRFPLLRSIVKEGLRTQLGNAFRSPRVAEKDMEYGGYFIPSGTVISMTPRETHLDPAIFPNPELFQPARWLGPDSTELDRYLCTFGPGPHRCLAVNFSRMAIQYVLAVTLSQFDITPLDCEKRLPQDRSLEMFPPSSAKGMMVYLAVR